MAMSEFGEERLEVCIFEWWRRPAAVCVYVVRLRLNNNILSEMNLIKSVKHRLLLFTDNEISADQPDRMVSLVFTKAFEACRFTLLTLDPRIHIKDSNR
jgi:hypothetical protein